jgi:hypothetical protein
MQLAEFDKEIEPYKTANPKKENSKIITSHDMLRFMQKKKAIVLYTDGSFAVACKIVNGKTNCEDFTILEEKISQWLTWLGHKEYAQRKELEEFEEAKNKLVKNKKQITHFT